MRMKKKRWARYALPAGFAERGYPKDSGYHTISKNMMGCRNLPYGCRITSGSIDIRGNKSDSNAKSTVTPHRRSTVLVEYPTQ
jgi:hypothetical protein